jgi:hypothetical protein
MHGAFHIHDDVPPSKPIVPHHDYISVGGMKGRTTRIKLITRQERTDGEAYGMSGPPPKKRIKIILRTMPKRIGT